MCGFAGFTEPGTGAERVLAAMLAPIRHRGPDQSGHYLDRRLALGVARLIVVSPEGGRQPRIDAVTGDALALNGEIYDYRRLGAELRRAGVALRDDSDTEVLFALIRRDGVRGALERIDGMFAFAFREGVSGRIFLARDRFGEKPLYYGLGNGGLVFASEVASLRRHPQWADSRFDVASIDQYLTFEYVPAGRSPFEGILKLRPGHLLTFSEGRARLEPYWRPPFGGVQLRRGTEDEEADRLESRLEESIQAKLVADVPVGVFLSGGVDSSLVTALAARHKPGIKAFTIEMPQASYDETTFATNAARHLRVDHRIIRLSEADVLGALDALDARLDEPFADPSLVPTYLLCKVAREEVTVALGGDGADELFAGYQPFHAARLAALWSAIPASLGPPLRRLIGLVRDRGNYMSLPFVFERLTRGFGVEPDLQPFHWMAAFTPGEKRGLLKGPLESRALENGLFEPVAEALAMCPSRDPLERLLHVFTALYLPDDILMKVDRASMYNSLEVRAPYLGRAFAEAALTMPRREKIRGFAGKLALKKLALRHLPARLVHRRKHGFALPVSSLIRGALRQRVLDTLLDRSNPFADWFDRARLERLIEEHLSGGRDHRKRLWTLYRLFKFGETAKAGLPSSPTAEPVMTIGRPRPAAG